MLECVINISEGRRPAEVAAIGAAAGRMLLDVHTDPDHHRSVLTLAGPDEQLEAVVRTVAAETVARLDLGGHAGVHPRRGVLDVVPFVDLDDQRRVTGRAIAARDRFACWAGETLALPCFRYGPGFTTLPEIRRRAWSSLGPDTGPDRPHPTAGATAVGARPVLVAYNLWLESRDVSEARAIARMLRGPTVRALGLALEGRTQVSCNLIDPLATGPADVYDAVSQQAMVARAETVGLVPSAVLEGVPPSRRRQLDLDPARTIESRLREAGLDRTAE